jgi:cleavage and polyadenylation specificity factor subunit 2
LGCLEEVQGWRGEVEVELPGQDGELKGKADGAEEAELQVRGLRGPFVATEEEVNEAFDQIKAVRYSQPIHLSGESSDDFLWAM